VWRTDLALGMFSRWHSTVDRAQVQLLTLFTDPSFFSNFWERLYLITDEEEHVTDEYDTEGPKQSNRSHKNKRGCAATAESAGQHSGVGVFPSQHRLCSLR
jgi:hypothetical protein